MVILRGLMLLFLVVFCATIMVYLYNYNSLDNTTFFIMVVILMALLWVSMKGDNDKQRVLEGYLDYFDWTMPRIGIDSDVFEQKLFKLPGKLKGIIVPQLDYVINSIGGGDDDENEKENSEKVTINDTDFIEKKDPDVTVNNKGVYELVEPKLQELKTNYVNIDLVLDTLKTADYELYKNVFVKLSG